jgi:hypothetical protein
LLVREQVAAGTEAVAAQSDGVGQPGRLRVTLAEVVDMAGVDGREIPGIPDAPGCSWLPVPRRGSLIVEASGGTATVST